MEMSSYARCFPDLLAIDDGDNFVHLMQNEDKNVEYNCDHVANSTTISTTPQFLLSSTGDNHYQRPFSSEICQSSLIGIPRKQPKSGTFHSGGPPQLHSHQLYAGWVVKPKNEEIVYNYSDEVHLSFSSIDWYNNKSSYDDDKRNQAVLISSRKGAAPQTPNHAKDHIMAERKRREKISQRLIALSAIVPGLNKMDKASVLENATKYLKQLEERVKVLEEQIKRKKSLESVVLAKKWRSCSGAADEHSCDGNNSHDLPAAGDLPEIEARISDKSVLIKIFCENHESILPKLLAEVENLHLTIVSSCALPFGTYATDITISAQMDAECCLSKKDLIRILRSALPVYVD